MSTDTPTPGRATLTDDERFDLIEEVSGWMPTTEGRANPQAWSIWVADRITARDAAREQALREEIRSLVTASKVTVHGRLALADTLTDWLAR